MIRNYIKTAVNILTRNKFFSAINILGLTLGITVCLLILMYIVNELSYESFQKNKHNIYRIAIEWGTEGNVMKFAGSMPALAPAINSQIPEVETAIRIRKIYDGSVKNNEGQEIKEENMFFADSGFFDVFSFILNEGDPGKSLTDPYSLVISEKMVAKYFGTSDPLGSTLFYNETPFRITGIMKDPPHNTHIECEFIISYSTLKALGQLPEQPWNSWGDDMTYLLLKINSRVSSVVPKLDEMLTKNAGDWLASRMKFDMQPLNEIHWDTEARGDIGNKGNKTYVYIFLSASLFVLIIACFNFLNLSISQYLGRMKEIGIRKTAGAQRQQMIIQFMTESFILIIISGLISVYLFETLYIWLYSYLGINFVITDHHFLLLALMVFLIIIVVGALAGAYPAFYFSRFRPIEILKNEITGTKRKLTFRKILVIFQFSISIILLAGTIVVFRQLNYMKNSSLGFTKENVVLVNLHELLQPDGNKYEVLREELLKNPNIRYVTGAYTLPGINSQMNIGVRRDGETPENSINLQALPADYGFVNSLGLEILEGRDFSREFSTDRLESVILNQAAVTSLRLEKPVGTKLFIPGEAYKNGVTVIGVVRDFHIQSFHNKINPILIFINPEMYSVMAIRINPQNTDETMGYLESTCNKILPGITPAYTFLDEAYDNLYNTEVKSSQLLTVFTLLALFISCLGLFGFTMFLVSKRIREIGIRKAMGAQAAGISLLLTGQFLIWIVASGIIAFPLAYLIITKWLSSFAFHVKADWWIFVLALSAELVIVVLTVSLLCWRAAARNPVEALRYE